MEYGFFPLLFRDTTAHLQLFNNHVNDPDKSHVKREWTDFGPFNRRLSYQALRANVPTVCFNEK